MKRWKKIALALLGLLLLSQTPFVYRRYRLGRLSAAIAEVNSQRTSAPPDERFDDYAGVFHVHSSLGGHDAVEVYNLYTNSKRISYSLLFFDGLWSYWSYPDLLFATFYARPDANLKKWDEINAAGQQRTYAVAGNDAHANVGLALQEQTGDKILEIKLDPYERSFRVVRNHVLVEKGEPLGEENLLSALRRGHSFIAFDLFGDSSGFRFTADNGTDPRTMRDEIALPDAGKVTLRVRSPVKCRMLFFRDGQALQELKDSTQAELSVDRKGVYRVELYLDQLGGFLEGKPWVISNPIFVR